MPKTGPPCAGRGPKFAPAGQSTQFIVGATATPDAETLTKSASLYKTYGLRRAYYSAFSPIPHADPALPLSRFRWSANTGFIRLTG